MYVERFIEHPFRLFAQEDHLSVNARTGTRNQSLRAQTYVVCLDCGREFEYDWDKMRIRKSVSMLIPTRVQEKPLGTL